MLTCKLKLNSGTWACKLLNSKPNNININILSSPLIYSKLNLGFRRRVVHAFGTASATFTSISSSNLPPSFSRAFTHVTFLQPATMADHKHESSNHPNPFTSIVSKFTDLLANFRFPPPPVTVEATENKPAGKTAVRGGEVAEESKPVTVRFGDPRPTTVAPLKLEAKEVEETKPVVLWQVYALGGFFILKWALARWNERRANNQSADEEDSSPPPETADEGNE